MRSPSARQRGRAWARVAATVGTLALLATAGSAAGEPDSTYPNAPKYGNSGFIASYNSATLTYAQKSKQWIRIPDVVLTASVFAVTTHPGAVSAACIRRLGTEMCTPPPGAEDRLISDAMTFPVADLPADPRDAHFDAFPDVTVRTVAFGAIPVEATLSLTLPTDADGLPIGLHATTISNTFPAGTGNPPPGVDPTATWQRFADTPVTGTVWVRVKALRVDGVPVDVGDRCRTTQPAALDLLGKGYANRQGDMPPVGSFTVGLGGTLKGTIDVPRFAGCGTGGDDFSALVTSVASGSGFPVEAQTGTVDGTHCWGINPAAIDWSQCPSPPELSIPTTAP